MIYKTVGYGVRKDTEVLDMNQVRELARKERPDLIVCGASAYPRRLDFKAFGQIADEVGCPLLADIAHIAGLVVGGVHPSPVPHAAFVTTTTHKTLRGPRGAIILCRKDYARAVDRAVFPGIQGGPLLHVIAAKAVAFAEAMRPEFRAYCQKVVQNAQTLAGELANLGWRIISGGTDNHLLLVDLRPTLPELTGHAAATWLARAGIIANKNAIPFDSRSPMEASGLRLGTPALTTRGMGPEQMKPIAVWIDQVLRAAGQDGMISAVLQAVNELCRQFPAPFQRG
jgi:glycine hydroxymethyltransferase